MYVLNITDDYKSFSNCTNNNNEDIIIIIKFLLLSMPGGTLFLSVINLIIWTMIKPSING